MSHVSVAAATLLALTILHAPAAAGMFEEPTGSGNLAVPEGARLSFAADEAASRAAKTTPPSDGLSMGADRHHASEEWTDGKWHLSFEPSVWYVAPTGRLYMPQTTPGAVKAFRTMLTKINADSPRATLFPEINLSKGNWGFGIRGFDFSMDPQSSTPGYNGTLGDITFGPTDRIKASLDFAAVDVEGRYRLWDKALGTNGKYSVAIDGLFGMRYYHVDWKIEQVTPISKVEEASESFLEPDIGFKVRVDFYDTFSIDFMSTFGYSPLKSHSANTVDILAGFQWRPWENVGVQIGYRQLLFDLKTGDQAKDFRYDGSLAGIYGGIVIHF